MYIYDTTTAPNVYARFQISGTSQSDSQCPLSSLSLLPHERLPPHFARISSVRARVCTVSSIITLPPKNLHPSTPLPCAPFTRMKRLVARHHSFFANANKLKTISGPLIVLTNPLPSGPFFNFTPHTSPATDPLWQVIPHP